MMFKTWAHPTTKLSADWVSYKIPPADLKRDLVRTIDSEQADDMWGHGAQFHYPKKGGLGGIWKAIAKKLPRNNVKFRAEVVQIDLEEKTAKTRDEIEIKYKVSSLEAPPSGSLALSAVSKPLFLESYLHNAPINTLGPLWQARRSRSTTSQFTSSRLSRPKRKTKHVRNNWLYLLSRSWNNFP